jgi:succinate dehydrogenase flavin-adding protein (antitoxin of CptAB toxin-antitoxin module)
VEFIESLSKEQRVTFMDIMESDDGEVFDIINKDLMGRIGVEAWGYW